MATLAEKIEIAIRWFEERSKGRPLAVTYSMAHRYGPRSYDCSSALDAAFTLAGIWPEDGPDNTDSLHADFEKVGWTRLQPDANGRYQLKRGDVVIWGRRGASGGAFGHTGIMVDDTSFIHCNYGYNGITVNPHDVIYNANGRPPFYAYRAPGTVGGKTAITPAVPDSTTVAKNPDAPHWVVESGDTLSKIAAYYGIPDKVNEIARYNAIANANIIHVGQKIFIPGPLVWTVEPGDTWEKINNYYGYSQGAVQSRNPGKTLTPGTVLNIWS